MTAYPLKPLPANNREFPYDPAVRPKRASPPPKLIINRLKN